MSAEAINYTALAEKLISNIQKFYPEPGASLVTNGLKGMIPIHPQAVAGMQVMASQHPGEERGVDPDAVEFRFASVIGPAPKGKRREFAALGISTRKRPTMDAEVDPGLDFIDEVLKYTQKFGGELHPLAMSFANILRSIQASGWVMTLLSAEAKVMFGASLGDVAKGVHYDTDHDVLFVEFYHKEAAYKSITAYLDYKVLSAEMIAQKLMKDE